MISSHKTRSAVAALAVGLAATCMGSGCASAPQTLVDPPPPPIPCPAGTAKTYKEHFPGDDEEHGVVIPPVGGKQYSTARNGGTLRALIVERWGDIPNFTPVMGITWFGQNRVYGRLTEVILPSGKHLPVCLDLEFNGPGLPMKPGSTRTEAITTNSATAIVVPESK